MELSLSEAQPFCGLNGAAQILLNNTGRGTIQVDAGQNLANEHDRPEHLHVMLSGWAYQYVLLPDGRRQIPALLLPGDMADFDLLSIERLEYGISTLTAGRVALLSRSALQAAIEGEPTIAHAFLNLALQKHAALVRRNVSIARQSARERVANLFCELATRLAAVGDQIEGQAITLALPLTQAEIGDLLGLSTVHVNRVLQELRALDLIRIASKRLQINDWSGLAAVGQFKLDDPKPGRMN